MDSSLALRSFHCTTGCVPHAPERIGRSFVSSSLSSLRKRTVHPLLVSCLKAPEVAAKSDDGAVEKPRSATFPASFESLIEEVCDETEIAELKLKIGGIEMHLRRNIDTPAPPPSISKVAPSVPVKPVEVSAPIAASSPASSPKPSERARPFINESFGRSPGLDALEASSGVTGYVLVASPMVGTFMSSKSEEGVKNPPLIREGSLVRKGQVIGFMDQCGEEHPLRSDAAGVVVKVLFDDGDPVSYGEPLIAVLDIIQQASTS